MHVCYGFDSFVCLCVCVAAGCVFGDGCCASASYPAAPLRINKVAKIQRVLN